MPMLRFAHLADLHLDTPFRGIAGINAELQAALVDASLKAWDNAVDICLRDPPVDFVLIAGDVYEHDEASVRAQLRFLRGLERLSEAGVPTFIVHGNHDPQGGRWSAIRAWPQLVTVFGHDGVDMKKVEKGGEPIALVHGMSYPERNVRDNLAARFSRSDTALYQIALLHANVGDQPEHGRYAPCSLEDLRRSGMDYWALGHVHARQTISTAQPTVVYPGNLQARHPGEEGSKGFYIVEVEPGGTPQLAFQAVDVWRYATIRLDLGHESVQSVDEVTSLLTKAAHARKGDRGLLATAEVVGRTGLHSDLRRRGMGEDLLRTLRDEAQADIWWNEVKLATRSPLDRVERMEAGDFVADLLRRSESGRAAATTKITALLDALGVAVREIDTAALVTSAEEIWDEAEQLAFDLVDREDER